MANRDVTVRLRAEIGNFEAAMKRASAATQDVAERGQGAFNKLTQAQREQEQAWSTLSTAAMVGGGSMIAAVGSVVAKYASFDKSMSTVQASTHASGVEMEKLRELAMRAGADTAYSGEEAAAGINELAKAGVATSDILNGGLNGALALAAAGEVEVADAAELAATAMTQFKLEGKDLGHVADLLAAGAGKAQGSVGDMGYALKQSGLVAAQAGISIEETVGSLSAFASAGLIGSDAGTSFKVMLQKLQNPSKEARAAMEELGISMYDSEGNFVGMVNLAEQLKTGMENLTPAQRDAAMATIFGSDAVRAANVLYAQGGAGIQEWINKVNDAGYAAETAAALQDNLAGDLEKLGGAFDTLALQSGGALNDLFREIVQGATSLLDLIGQIPGPVLTATTAIVGLGGAGLLTVGGLMKGVTAVAEFKDAADALGLKLPELDSKMGRFAHNATMFATYVAAAGIALNLAFEGTESAAIGSERMGNALAGAAGDIEGLNAAFRNAEWANGNGSWWQGSIDGINGVGDAIANVQSLSWAEEVGSWGAGLIGISDNTAKLREDITNLDTALAGMASGGSMEKAQDAFKQIAEDTKTAGGDISKLADQFPQLEAAILNYASSLGVTLTEQETLAAMMGDMPPKLVAAQEAANNAAGGADTLAGSLGELGEEAEKTEKSFKDLVAAMESMGGTYVAQEQAYGAFTESLGEIQAQMVKISESGTLLSDVFDATTGNLNRSTEVGRETAAAFDDVRAKGLELAGTMAEAGASHEELTGQLVETYNQLYNNATQLGLTAEQADTLARKMLDIPAEVSVESYMSEEAFKVAGQTQQAVEAIPGQVDVASSMEATARLEAEATKGALDNVPKVLSVASAMEANARTEADMTRTALGMIPTSHHTYSSMGADARLEADATRGAIDNVPDAKGVSLTATADARLEADATKRAIDAIPVMKRVSIETTRSEVIKQTRLHSAIYDGKAYGGLVGGLAGGGMPAEVRGFARGGGLLPGVPPATQWVDNLPGVVMDTGEPIMLRSREFVVNEPGTHRGENLAWLRWMNSGGTMHTPPGRGFAVGGSLATLPAQAVGAEGHAGPIHAAIESGVDSALSRWEVSIEENDRGFAARMRRAQKMR